MNILYVFHLDPEDPGVQSGRPFSILRQMRERGHHVDLLIFRPRLWTKPYLRKMFAALRRRRYGSEVSSLEAWAYARAIRRRLKAAPVPYDMVFTPSIRPYTALETETFTVACNDTLFVDLIETYPQFANDDPAYVRKGAAQEAQALANTDLLILPSHAAIAVAKGRYAMPEDRIHFAMFGSNLGWYPSAAEIDGAIESRLAGAAASFLFVGRDWIRKGGTLVAQTAQALRLRGLAAQVHVVGLDRPDDLPAEWDAFVHFHGKLPLATAAGAKRLFELAKDTGFFFLPSRAEAYGMSFVEAAAFGLPLIGADVGGISDIIREDMGVKLPADATPEAVADWVERVLSDREAYRRMAGMAFAASVERLNWTMFWESCEQRITSARGALRD